VSGQWLLWFRLAWANLWARRVNLVVGALVLSSTFLLTVFGSIAEAMERNASSTLVHAFLGQFQVFSTDSQGELALFSLQDDRNLKPLQELDRVKASLERVEGVARVIPMGRAVGVHSEGNVIDELSNALRAGLRSGASMGDASMARHVARLRHVVGLLRSPLGPSLMDAVFAAEAPVALEHAASPEFEQQLATDPLAALDEVDRSLAPLLGGGGEVNVPVVGVAPETLQSPFDVFEAVDGTLIPPGEHGVVLPKLLYEDSFKLRPVRRLDKLLEAVEQGRSLEEEPELRRSVASLREEVGQLLVRLDPGLLPSMVEQLRGALSAPASDDLPALLTELVSLTQANARERVALFRRVVEPALTLYLVRPGDLLTLQAQGRSGYTRSLRLRVWGTYRLKGLAMTHPPASALGMVDPESLEQLLGYSSNEELEEIRKLEEQMGVGTETKEQLEAGLFETGTPAPEAVRAKAPTAQGRIALSAAVWLLPGVDEARVAERLDAMVQAEHLPVTVVPWTRAGGDLAAIAQAVSAIVFGVSLLVLLMVGFVLSNTVLISMLQRVREVGTMRAIGTSRATVMGIVLGEVWLVTALFGGAGAVLGAALVSFLSTHGLSSPDSQLDLLFGGAALHPALSSARTALSLATVMAVGAVAAAYPAWKASLVPPVEAMRSEGA